MLACIGYIVPEYFKWPGYLSPSDGLKFADIPHGLEAITRVPAVGWTQVVFFGLGLELFGATQDPTKPPGKLSSRLVIGLTEIKNKSLAGGIRNEGYAFGPFGIPNAPSIADPELRKKKLNAELANGRLAMVAIMGMMFQNGTVGTTGPEMWLGASAIPKSMEGTGGPFPDDVWDPLGLSVGKSEEQLLRWRAVELKHGRVAMLAVIGWIHVGLGYHLIGDWASRGTVSNNPLVNVTELSMGGAFQLVFTIMCFEWLTTYVCKPPKDAPWDVFGWSEIIAYPDDPKWKERQLQELNNGRLAMVAFIGLVAQTLVTGDYGVSGFGEITFANGAPWPESPGFEAGRFKYPEVGGNVGYASGPAKEMGENIINLYDRALNSPGRGELIVKVGKAPI
jgi:light-harvesting complex I chlorophyll a/b binding protein 1